MTDEGDTRSRAKRDSDVVATWHFRRRHVALLVALASAPNGLVAYRAYSDKPAETREESRQGREAIARQVRGLWKFSGEAHVDGVVAAEADLMCTVRELPPGASI